MPEKRTIERAKRAKRAGKAPTTQAGEFVREEIHHVREGKHGARSPKQAIAIGLSKARRAGVELGPRPKRGKKRAANKKTAGRVAEGDRGQKSTSRAALSRQGRAAAAKRSPTSRSQAAKKAARTRKSPKATGSSPKATRNTSRRAQS